MILWMFLTNVAGHILILMKLGQRQPVRKVSGLIWSQMVEMHARLKN